MRLHPIAGLLLVTVCLSSSPAAQSQSPGSVTLFSGTNFGGLSTTLDSARNDIRLMWPVRSVRVGRPPGWRLCTRTRLRDCTVFDRSRADVRIVLRSAEPVSDVVLLPEPVPPGGGVGRSLRGMASEYFPAPADARGRIPSCPSGGINCVRDSAQRFCRSRGWNHAIFAMQETVNRREFLADVLCAQARMVL